MNPERDLPRIEELETGRPLRPAAGDRGLEVAPRSVHGSGRRGSGRRIAVIPALVVVLVAVAVWKPWGETPLRPTVLIDFDAPGSASTLGPGRTFAGPDAGLPTDPPAPIGVQFPADYAREPISPMIASHAGAWGLGSGAWWEWSRVPWSWWSPVEPQPTQLTAGDAGLPRRIDCLTATRLPVGLFVAITAPLGELDATSVAVEEVGEDGRATPVETIRMTTPADRGMAYLLRADLERWGTTAYRLMLTGPMGPRTLELCLFQMPPRTAPSAGPGSPAPTPSEIFAVGEVPAQLLDWAWADREAIVRVAPLVAVAGGHAETLGVGTGGLDPEGEPWSGWLAVPPAAAGPPPAACGDDLPRLTLGSVVAVTTGLPVADPWAVSVLRVREDGTGSVPDGLVRPQPVFDGIVVFARRDGSAWEPGPYRFAFARPDGPVALDVCLGD